MWAAARRPRALVFLEVPSQGGDPRAQLQTATCASAVSERGTFTLEILDNSANVRLHVLRPVRSRQTRDILTAVCVNGRGTFAQRVDFRRFQLVQGTERTDRGAAVPQAAGRQALADAGIEARLAAAPPPQDRRGVISTAQIEEVRARSALVQGKVELRRSRRHFPGRCRRTWQGPGRFRVFYERQG